MMMTCWPILIFAPVGRAKTLKVP